MASNFWPIAWRLSAMVVSVVGKPMKTPFDRRN